MTERIKALLGDRKLTIAVSGKSGCGNTTFSSLLAERLGLTLINYTFRSLAAERGVSMEQIMAEAAASDAIDRLVDSRQVEMAREGNCVLASRLAIWLLEDADMKIYLHAEPRIRVQRIGQREGWTLEQTLAHTEKRDQEDHRRYLELYGIDNDDYSLADLVLDSGRLNPEELLEAAMAELEKRLAS